MNRIIQLSLVSLSLFSGTEQAFAAETPNALASELSSAIAAKDLNAAGKLVEWAQAPVVAYRMFKMTLADCFAPATCKVEVAAMTEEEKKPQPDYHFTTVPEGKLKITPPDGNGGTSFPFAKINNQYKIIIGAQTPESYAQVKAAADAKKIAADLDADLVGSGQPLPADGGAPSAGYREYLAAITRGDTAFLADHGTSGDRYYFGTAYKNNPVKAAVALELAKMESLAQATVKGGFVKDNRALLLVSGLSGQGWTTEGAVTLVQEGDKWVIEEKRYLSYPPIGSTSR
jgi:hypothetical protein